MNDLKTINLLLIEDSASDTYLIKQTLQNMTHNITVYSVGTGEDGLHTLQSIYESGSIIHMILLDINLPGIDGFDVAEQIKKDNRYRSIPIVVLTSSSNEHDIGRMYNLQASCYLTKPVTLEKFVDTVNSIGEFWIDLVHLPK